MNYILFDDSTRANFLPLTFLRPLCDIRIGILTIREKWEILLKAKTSTLTEGYLSENYPLVKADKNILINGSVSPSPELVKAVMNMKENQTLIYGDYIIAMSLSGDQVEGLGGDVDIEEVAVEDTFIKLNYMWDIFAKNSAAIAEDFKILTKGKKSAKISPTNRVLGEENIFIEEGAEVEFATINATTGPVYVGKNACIMENAALRGPIAICESATVKMGAKIYGGTTVGPFSKVGGEMNKTVIFGYSNKAHDGYIGDSVIGEWCNIGADSNVSNLKNTYDEVRLWSIPQQKFVGTGLQFCGVIMGDHSKCGINTMFNTGSVVGISSNIFGHGYQRNYINSFSWGGNQGFKPFEIDKAIEVAERMMERRNVKMTDEYRKMFIDVYNQTKRYKHLR